MVNPLSGKDSCAEEHRDEGPLRGLPQPSVQRLWVLTFLYRVYSKSSGHSRAA